MPVLLLDEPTTHLDLEGILWLEKLLATESLAFSWSAVAERLGPVPEDGFFESRGRYGEFLERKDAVLREQARWQERLANRVRREVE